MAAERMNGYGLIASIIQSIASLAWPAAFVIAVWLFREKIGKLLPLIYVKHKDWEASFRLDKAEEEAAALPPAAHPTPEAIPTQEETERFNQLAKISPRGAIVELRAELDDAVRNAASRHGVDKSSTGTTMVGAIRQLRNLQVIDTHTAAILDDLRNVGNTAVHSTSTNFTEADALRYRKLANEVTVRLNARQGEL
jgi:Domain of unknown function (DUF4145)